MDALDEPTCTLIASLSDWDTQTSLKALSRTWRAAVRYARGPPREPYSLAPGEQLLNDACCTGCCMPCGCTDAGALENWPELKAALDAASGVAGGSSAEGAAGVSPMSPPAAVACRAVAMRLTGGPLYIEREGKPRPLLRVQALACGVCRLPHLWAQGHVSRGAVPPGAARLLTPPSLICGKSCSGGFGDAAAAALSILRHSLRDLRLSQRPPAYGVPPGALLNPLTAAAGRWLARLRGLRVLHLEAAPGLGDTGLAPLLADDPPLQLTQLKLGNVGLTAASGPLLTRLRGLQVLVLSDAPAFGDAGAAPLLAAPPPDLFDLRLVRLSLTAASGAPIAQLRGLATLVLSGAPAFGDAGAAPLLADPPPKLMLLELDDVGLTDDSLCGISNAAEKLMHRRGGGPCRSCGSKEHGFPFCTDKECCARLHIHSPALSGPARNMIKLITQHTPY